MRSYLLHLLSQEQMALANAIAILSAMPTDNFTISQLEAHLQAQFKLKHALDLCDVIMDELTLQTDG